MKKIFTILLLFVCFVSVPSCQKDSNGKGDNLTLTAYPYTGYSFFGWYENGLLISQNSTLSFIVSQDRTLLAVFEEN